MSRPDRLMIVDSCRASRARFACVAERLGFAVVKVTDEAEMQRRLAPTQPTAILLVVRNSRADGISALRALRDSESAARIVIAGACSERHYATVEHIGSILGLDIDACPSSHSPLQQVRDALRASRRDYRALEKIGAQQLLHSGELLIRYRPKIAVGDGLRWRLIGADVQPSWVDGDAEPLSMADWLTLARERNAAEELTLRVASSVAEQLHAWHAEGLHLSTTLPLSRRLVDDPVFPERLRHAVCKAGADPEAVTLEFQAADIMAEPQLSPDIINAFDRCGFGLAISDVGIDGVSIRQIAESPYRELLIDAALVCGAQQSEPSLRAVAGISALGRRLGLHIVARGVQAPRIIDAIRDTACDSVQGPVVGGWLSAGDLQRMARRGALGHDAVPSLPGHAV